MYSWFSASTCAIHQQGKILTLGGGPDYVNSAATRNAHIVTIDAPNSKATVRKIGSMAYARAFHNSIILPDGKVY